jgi:hypothetical protein
MIIDLKRTVLKIQLRRFITLLVLVIIILALLSMLDSNESYLGLTKYQWLIFVCAIYVVSTLYQAFLEPNYIYFSDQGDKIILRYFSMSFFNNKKQTIEIPKQSFSGYELKLIFGGLKQKLILYERVKNVDAKYPAVSITALSSAQKKNILAALDRYKLAVD